VPAIHREISAATQRREERALRARVNVVERLACVGVLARGLVHDLNGGLAVLSSNVEYALAAGATGESAEALQDARLAATKLGETINSLRAFTSITEGASTLEPERMLAAAVRLVRTGVGVGVEVAVEASAVPTIHASEAMIVQLFYTLLLTALGEGGQGRRRIEVRLDSMNDRVRLRVGPVEATSVEKGAMLERTVRESLCRHLVADAGGQMMAEVDAQGTTTWTVVLPSATDDRKVPRPSTVPAAADLSEMRVLVIDDDPMLCRTLARVLWPARARVRSTSCSAI
jgi:hypothetical protein